MAPLAPRKRAAGQNPHTDRANAVALGYIQKLAVVLCGISVWNGFASRWRENIVEDLRAIKATRLDQLVKCIRITFGGKAEVARFAFVSQFNKCRYDIIQNLIGRHVSTARGATQCVVQLKDINVILLQASKAGFEGCPDRSGGIGMILFGQANFRTDNDAVTVAAERTAKIRFRGTIPI